MSAVEPVMLELTEQQDGKLCISGRGLYSPRTLTDEKFLKKLKSSPPTSLVLTHPFRVRLWAYNSILVEFEPTRHLIDVGFRPGECDCGCECAGRSDCWCKRTDGCGCCDEDDYRESEQYDLPFGWVYMLWGISADSETVCKIFHSPVQLLQLSDQVEALPLPNVYASGNVCMGEARPYRDFKPLPIDPLEFMSIIWGSVFNLDVDDFAATKFYQTLMADARETMGDQFSDPIARYREYFKRWEQLSVEQVCEMETEDRHWQLQEVMVHGETTLTSVLLRAAITLADPPVYTARVTRVITPDTV